MQLINLTGSELKFVVNDKIVTIEESNDYKFELHFEDEIIGSVNSINVYRKKVVSIGKLPPKQEGIMYVLGCNSNFVEYRDDILYHDTFKYHELIGGYSNLSIANDGRRLLTKPKLKLPMGDIADIKLINLCKEELQFLCCDGKFVVIQPEENGTSWDCDTEIISYVNGIPVTKDTYSFSGEIPQPQEGVMYITYSPSEREDVLHPSGISAYDIEGDTYFVVKGFEVE